MNDLLAAYSLGQRPVRFSIRAVRPSGLARTESGWRNGGSNAVQQSKRRLDNGKRLQRQDARIAEQRLSSLPSSRVAPPRGIAVMGTRQTPSDAQQPHELDR